MILEVPKVTKFPLLGFIMKVQEHYRNSDAIYIYGKIIRSELNIQSSF